MTDQHPITPTPELLEQWEAETAHTTKDEAWHIAVQAASWGADQELEACCEVLARELICDGKHVATGLRIARRPKPPSLKAQALAELVDAYDEDKIDDTAYDTICRALEQLDD